MSLQMYLYLTNIYLEEELGGLTFSRRRLDGQPVTEAERVACPGPARHLRDPWPAEVKVTGSDHALFLQGPSRGAVREGAGADRPESRRPDGDQVRGLRLPAPLPGTFLAFRQGLGWTGEGQGGYGWLPELG